MAGPSLYWAEAGIGILFGPYLPFLCSFGKVPAATNKIGAASNKKAKQSRFSGAHSWPVLIDDRPVRASMLAFALSFLLIFILFSPLPPSFLFHSSAQSPLCPPYHSFHSPSRIPFCARKQN
jgi:hypothetical protein